MKSSLSSPVDPPEGYVRISALATELDLKGSSSVIIIAEDGRYNLTGLSNDEITALSAFWAAHVFVFYHPGRKLFWGEL